MVIQVFLLIYFFGKFSPPPNLPLGKGEEPDSLIFYITKSTLFPLPWWERVRERGE
jgi:hypothetical protein